VEALTNSVRPRALGLGTGVIDILDREVELIKSRLIRKLRKPRASFSAGAGEAQFTPPTTYDKHGSPLSEPARSGAD
jgi:hypothetical protein